MTREAQTINRMTGDWSTIRASIQEKYGEYGLMIYSLRALRSRTNGVDKRRERLEALGFSIDTVLAQSQQENTSRGISVAISWLFNQVALGVCFTLFQESKCELSRCTFKHEVVPLPDIEGV